jgi:hypothetical protein
MALSAYDPSATLRAYGYPTAWRMVSGILVVLSRASLPFIGVGVLTTDGPVPLIVLVRALFVCALLPALAAWLIERAFAADVEVHATELVVHGRGLRMEIPRTAIAAVEPWALPLPGPGFALRMQSGRRFSYGLQATDPTALLSALADDAGIDAARAATYHSTFVYAHARRSGGRWHWYHLLAKFVLFALVPTAVWFHAHQHIAYGGLLGQYYLEGLGPYLKTFVISWGLVTIYLLLYASVWRALAEGVALVAACFAPARATMVRRAVEIACRLVYYLGVPVLTLLPFLT